MSILDEVRAEGDPRRGRCKVCAWLEGREDRDEWLQAFRDVSFTHAALHRVARRHGLDVNLSTLARHIKEKHDAQ